MKSFLLVKEPMKRIVVLGLVLASVFFAVPSVHADNLSPFLQALAATFKVETPDYSCTATAIKTDGTVTYFLTARHCTVQTGPYGKEIPGSTEDHILLTQPGQTPVPVQVFLRGADATHDWAILIGQYAATAVIKIGFQTPFIGEPIIVSGYPLGLGPIVTQGAVSGLDIHASPDIPPYYFAINVFADPGSSGSSVIDLSTMTVIGILDMEAVDGQGDPPIVVADSVSDISPEALAKVRD